jgi:hypothetical protein
MCVWDILYTRNHFCPVIFSGDSPAALTTMMSISDASQKHTKGIMKWKWISGINTAVTLKLVNMAYSVLQHA